MSWVSRVGQERLNNSVDDSERQKWDDDGDLQEEEIISLFFGCGGRVQADDDDHEHSDDKEEYYRCGSTKIIGRGDVRAGRIRPCSTDDRTYDTAEKGNSKKTKRSTVLSNFSISNFPLVNPKILASSTCISQPFLQEYETCVDKREES